MLKSLFFRQKTKADELLPPPPPFPSMELENETDAKKESQPSAPVFESLFSDTKQPKKSKIKGDKAANKPEFEDLLADIDSGIPQKSNGKIKPELGDDMLDELFKENFEKVSDLSKFSKRTLNENGEIMDNSKFSKDAIAETKVSPRIKKGAKKPAKLKKGRSKANEDILQKLGIDSIKPEKIESLKEFEFPENLEDIDIESELKEFSEPAWHSISPNAEKEIMDAIGQAKRGKPGFIDALKQKLAFTRKKRRETEAKVYETKQNMPIDEIQIKIDEARNALMDFRLKKAKELYIEIMRLYSQLSPEEQAKVYNQINDLYLERKSAEQLTA